MRGGGKDIHLVRYLDWENRDLFNREVKCFPAFLATAPDEDGICEVIDEEGKAFMAFHSALMLPFAWHSPNGCAS